LDPADFFALVRRAYRSVTIPAPLLEPTQAVEQTPDAIAAAFVRANPSWPAQSVVVTCSNQGTPRLREVHVCFDRNLSPRSCSADALRGACRAPQVIIPPIR
jgi:ribonuclease I